MRLRVANGNLPTPTDTRLQTTQAGPGEYGDVKDRLLMQIRTPADSPGWTKYNYGLCTAVQTAPKLPTTQAPGSRPVGPRFVLFAGIFYGLLVVAAALWSGVRGFQLDFLGNSVPLSLFLGALTAVVTVSSGLLLYGLVPVLRQVAQELAPRLVDGTSNSNLILVSLFSGVGEEVFFRGAVQQEFGLLVASVLFGVVHIGPDHRYLVWTAWAVLAGLIFGVLYSYTGGLLAPILAHASHNAATLLFWKRSRKGAGRTVGPGAP